MHSKPKENAFVLSGTVAIEIKKIRLVKKHRISKFRLKNVRILVQNIQRSRGKPKLLAKNSSTMTQFCGEQVESLSM